MSARDLIDWIDSRMFDPIVQQQLCGLKLNQSGRIRNGELELDQCSDYILAELASWISIRARSEYEPVIICLRRGLDTKYLTQFYPVAVDRIRGTVEIAFDAVDTGSLVFDARAEGYAL